jgi:hypothetical protein
VSCHFRGMPGYGLDYLIRRNRELIAMAKAVCHETQEAKKTARLAIEALDENRRHAASVDPLRSFAPATLPRSNDSVPVHGP